MSAIGSWALQAAIVTALRARSALVAKVPGGILDYVPQNTPTPCIVVGEGEETDASSFGQEAHRVVTAIQVWTQDPEYTAGTTGAAGYKVALDIANDITDELLNGTLTVEGHDVIVTADVTLTKDRPDETDPSLRLVTVSVVIYLEDNPSA